MAKELSVVLKQYKATGKSNVWHKNPEIKKKLDLVLSKYRKTIYNSITANTANAWNLAEGHNDNLVNSYTKGLVVPEALNRKMFSRNIEALNAFNSRKRSGLNLSERVWNLTKQTKDQLETFIAEGLTQGRSAASLATDLKRYLKEPERRFRRLKDTETGKLILSDPAKKYKPGRGVYRSSYKNALRLSRNETNIAYRSADQQRRKNLPFVLGIKVNLSPAHPEYDICDELQGEYPKEFVFPGWHTNCLCFTTSIMLSKEDFAGYLNGNGIDASKYIKSIPKNAANYIRENSERFKSYSQLPYFIKDNFKSTKNGFELKKSIGVPLKNIKKIPELSEIEILKREGIEVNSTNENYNEFKKSAANFNLLELFNQLEKDLNSNGINNVSKYVYLRSNGFDFELKSKGFVMSRKVTYRPEGNNVYHAYLKVPKEKQGNGLTKKMFQTLFKQYEAGNIKRINVTANIDVGGYAWARYGFSATDKSDVLDVIRESKDKNFIKKAKSKINYHYKKYGNEKPFPMIRLTKIEGGKKALLGTFWSGTIDLNNKKEKEWFVNYLFK